MASDAKRLGVSALVRLDKENGVLAQPQQAIKLKITGIVPVQ